MIRALAAGLVALSACAYAPTNVEITVYAPTPVAPTPVADGCSSNGLCWSGLGAGRPLTAMQASEGLTLAAMLGIDSAAALERLGAARVYDGVLGFETERPGESLGGIAFSDTNAIMMHLAQSVDDYTDVLRHEIAHIVQYAGEYGEGHPSSIFGEHGALGALHGDSVAWGARYDDN